MNYFCNAFIPIIGNSAQIWQLSVETEKFGARTAKCSPDLKWTILGIKWKVLVSKIYVAQHKAHSMKSVAMIEAWLWNDKCTPRCPWSRTCSHAFSHCIGHWLLCVAHVSPQLTLIVVLLARWCTHLPLLVGTNPVTMAHVVSAFTMVKAVHVRPAGCKQKTEEVKSIPHNTDYWEMKHCRFYYIHKVKLLLFEALDVEINVLKCNSLSAVCERFRFV